MSTFRHILTAIALPVMAMSFCPTTASAQYGWVHLATHLSGKPALPSTEPGNGFTALYLKNLNGTETKLASVEFPVGTYTLARVTGRYRNCDTEAINITFSITSGQHTFVDVPMAFTTCDVEFTIYSRGGGLGMLQLITSANVITAECRIALNNAGRIEYVEHQKRCHATLPYRANMQFVSTPLTSRTKNATGDSVAVSSAFRPDTMTYIVGDGFIGQSTVTDPFPDELVAQHPDLKLVRTGGTYGGQMVTAQFTLTNESAFRAQQVTVTKELRDSLFGSGYTISQMTATRGDCNGNRGPSCYLQQVLPGDTIQLSIAQFNRENTPGNVTPYCKSVVAIQPPLNGTPAITETDTTNNRQPCRATSVQVAIALGSNAPLSRPVTRGTSNAPILQFSMNPASPQTLNSITLRASGSGNEQVDVTGVHLYVDVNGNGAIDANDTALASGTFPANDGTVVLTIAPPYTVSGPTSFLVTYDFNTTIAPRLGTGTSTSTALLFLPAFALPLAFRRKRAPITRISFLSLTVCLASCGGGSDSTAPPVVPPVTSIATYQATLTGVNLSGVDVPGVSLVGATISVTR